MPTRARRGPASIEIHRWIGWGRGSGVSACGRERRHVGLRESATADEHGWKPPSLHGGVWGTGGNTGTTAYPLDMWSKSLTSGVGSVENTLMKARRPVKEMHNLKRKSRASCADPAYLAVGFDAV